MLREYVIREQDKEEYKKGNSSLWDAGYDYDDIRGWHMPAPGQHRFDRDKSDKKDLEEIKTPYGTGNLGPGPKATEQGVKDNYYVKAFGFKLVNRKKQAKASKAIDYKDLWGATYK